MCHHVPPLLLLKISHFMEGSGVRAFLLRHYGQLMASGGEAFFFL